MVLKILFFLICCTGLQAELNPPIEITIDHEEKKFYILTIPKSGSHLIMKLITSLTGRTYNDYLHANTPLGAFRFIADQPDEILNTYSYSFSNQIEGIWINHSYPLSHFNFGPLLRPFLDEQPDYLSIIQIRDLRDVCVSCVFMLKNNIAKEIGSDDFNEQLMYIITMGHQIPANRILNIHRNAEEAISWYNDKNVIVCRFEDLVGEKGGGKNDTQRRQIITLANALSIPLEMSEVDKICEELFGTQKGPQFHSTFRSGQIGSWREYFTNEHIDAFNSYMGHLQIALGYSLD